MMLLRNLLTLLCLVVSNILFAQHVAADTTGKPAKLNQTDNKGRRQGLWLIEVPAQMGEPATTQFGNFLNGLRTGAWYTMDSRGDLTALEHYKAGLLSDEVKYFENGRLLVSGNYLALNPGQVYDTVIILNPLTGVQFEKVITTDHGSLRHGIWRTYDPLSGQVVREDYYQADDLMDHKVYPIKQDSTWIRYRTNQLPHNQKQPRRPQHDPASSIYR